MNIYDVNPLNIIDKMNHIHLSSSNHHRYNANYTCRMCGGDTTIEDSYSCQGYNLVCIPCIKRVSAVLGMPFNEAVHKIWEQGQKEMTEDVEGQ
jgi:hypothetical protein